MKTLVVVLVVALMLAAPALAHIAAPISTR
jgi:hypothetical protein